MNKAILSLRGWRLPPAVAVAVLVGIATTAQAAEGHQATKGKVLMPIGDASESMDTLYALYRLQEEGYEVVVAGPEARIYHLSLHEVPPDSRIPWDITQERAGYHLKADTAFRDVDPSQFTGIFISGGRAPEYLRYDQDLMRIARHFFETGKPVGVICHGVEIPAAAGVLKGRKLTTVPKCALDITQVGGTYVDKPYVDDGNLISARGWQDYRTPFLRLYIEKLKAADYAARVSPAGAAPKN